MSTGNPTQAGAALTRERIDEIRRGHEEWRKLQGWPLREEALKDDIADLLAELDRRDALSTGVGEGETLRTARDSWWRELTRKGDPARRTNLAFEAFEAGFQAAFRMTETETSLQRERDEALAEAARYKRDLREWLLAIASGRRASIGSPDNTYCPQLSRERVDVALVALSSPDEALARVALEEGAQRSLLAKAWYDGRVSHPNHRRRVPYEWSIQSVAYANEILRHLASPDSGKQETEGE